MAKENQIWRSYTEQRLAQEDCSRALFVRQEAVSMNRSRSCRGLAPLPVPAKPLPVLLPVAYLANGSYGGIIEDPEQIPPGGCVKWKTGEALSKEADQYLASLR